MGTKKEFSYIDQQTEGMKECNEIRIHIHAWNEKTKMSIRSNHISISQKTFLKIIKIIKQEEATQCAKK
jgi:hypothetical protein